MDGRIKLVLVAVISILISYFVLQARPADATASCAKDSDCVPAQCCHTTFAVNKQHAPDCQRIFCSQECRTNTLDCGQGEIKCMNKVCKVILK